MSNLEHLIENTLMALEDGRPYDDVISGIKMDINFPACNLTEQEVWEICQYVKYTWCQELKGQVSDLKERLKKAQLETLQWANTYATLLASVTDSMIKKEGLE